MLRNTIEVTATFGVTVLLVAMTPAQVHGWKWVGDETRGEDPVMGWEVRDTTGALLGVMLPLGHRARQIHTEFFDPAIGDFEYAGVTNAPILRHGITRILAARRHNVGPVPAGKDFRIDVPNWLKARTPCTTSRCPQSCTGLEAEHRRREREALAAAEAAQQSAAVAAAMSEQLELDIVA